MDIGTYRPKHFGDAELHGHRPFCTDEILRTIDKLRDIRGASILVSPVPGAVARFGAPNSRSQHSVDYWGACNAIDLFVGLDPYSVPEWKTLLAQCHQAGANGVGFYPEAVAGNRQGMVHVDCRQGSYASWSAWRKKVGRGWKYLAISEVLAPEPKGLFAQRMQK